MKKILILTLCLILSGCASSNRLTKLKNKGENVVRVEVKGDIPKAKELCREVASELKLIERTTAATEDFMLVNTNKLKGGIIQAVSGGLGAMAYFSQLGLFFECNKDEDITTITIAEEVSSFGDPRRFVFVDKIKLKQLELSNRK